MQTQFPGLGLLSLTLVLTGCTAGSSPTMTPPDTQTPPAAGAQIPTGEIRVSPIIDKATGANFEALGVWWLERDVDAPLDAQLTMARSASTAQGDVYEFSVRPFLTPQSLKVIRTENAGEATDYTVEFTHPFAMPGDINRPASAAKRLDLFLFAVLTVLVAHGDDQCPW